MTTRNLIHRWSAPLALAVASLLAAPTATAQSSDQLARVIVDVADVIIRGDTAYDRHGRYGPEDRLIVTRDRYGRPVYYREVPRYHRSGPPYGKAYGYYGQAPGQRKAKRHGHRYDGRYYDRDDDRYDRRYRDRDDDRYYSRHRDDDRGRGRGRGRGDD